MQPPTRHIATDFSGLMFVPPTFRQDDVSRSMAFMTAHPFALIAVNGDQGPVTVLAPLVVSGDGQTLLGHVARANPFWRAAIASSNAVAIFKDVDGYVSPSGYVSKSEHGRAVPTWNYEALEVRGEIIIETNLSEMHPLLETLTEKMESHRDEPWKMSDAPDDYIEKLSRAIVGFRMNIEDISHVRKLSQNKSEADKLGVISMLEKSGLASDKNLALAMKE